MGLVLLVILLVLIFGGGSLYTGGFGYGTVGHGGMLGLVLIIVLVLVLLGRF
jgi:hypothetical protein